MPTNPVIQCEFCQRRLAHKTVSVGDTVCTRCDKAMEKDWEMKTNARNSNHNRKCRICSERLSLDRYFDCTRCVPPSYNGDQEDFEVEAVGWGLHGERGDRGEAEGDEQGELYE